MSYLTLAEAAQYVTNKTGVEVEPAALLRAGAFDALLISAPFSGLMRNLTNSRNDEVLGLLVIPPKHTFEIETDGHARIVEACSLDGKTRYSPQVVRTRDQLRVLVSELDRTIAAGMWIAIDHADTLPPKSVPSGASEKDGLDTPNDETPEQYRARLLKRHNNLMASGEKAPTKTIAEEEGITDSRVRSLLREARGNAAKKTNAGISLFGQIAAANNKKR